MARRRESPRPGWKQRALAYVGVLIGAATIAAALNWFLVPNRIAAGGASGLATILFHLWGWPVGAALLGINLPLFLASLRLIGLRFGIKSVVGTLATAAFVDGLAPYMRPLTEDLLLASIYGGVVSGIGIGIALRSGGSTGGTDIAARIVERFSPISVGSALLAVDGAVIVLSGVVFDAEVALYALVAVFITGKTIDLVQVGQAYAKAAFVISERSKEIRQAILLELDRGVTTLSVTGAYTGKPREALFVIVGRHEIHALRTLVRRLDAKAFVAITDVSDVLGEGFGELGPP